MNENRMEKCILKSIVLLGYAVGIAQAGWITKREGRTITFKTFRCTNKTES